MRAYPFVKGCRFRLNVRASHPRAHRPSDLAKALGVRPQASPLRRHHRPLAALHGLSELRSVAISVDFSEAQTRWRRLRRGRRRFFHQRRDCWQSGKANRRPGRRKGRSLDGRICVKVRPIQNDARVRLFVRRRRFGASKRRKNILLGCHRR